MCWRRSRSHRAGSRPCASRWNPPGDWEMRWLPRVPVTRRPPPPGWASSARGLRRALGEVPFGALDVEAERWPPGAGGLMFLPYLSGERTPHNDPDVRAAFIGLGLEHDRGAMARAVMEGVAYGLRDSVELLAEL